MTSLSYTISQVTLIQYSQLVMYMDFFSGILLDRPAFGNFRLIYYATVELNSKLSLSQSSSIQSRQ